MRLAEILDEYERRASEAAQVKASAPLADVYRAVIADLRTVSTDTRPHDGLLSTGDAAKVLGVLPKTVAHWCEAGKLADAQKTSPGKGGRWLIPAVSVYRLGTPAPRAPRLWKAMG